MSKWYFFILCFTFLLSCDDIEKNKLIVGKWKCVQWFVNDNSNANTSEGVGFLFKDNKSYEYNNASLLEKGTYKIEGGNLFTTPDGQLELSVKIEKLTNDSLIFNMSRGGMPETMILIREK